MQRKQTTGFTAGRACSGRLCAALAGVVLAGVALVASADVNVCSKPGELLSLRVSFQTSVENAIIVSDSKGRRLVGFNSFFARGADAEWSHGDGSWQAPQGSEGQCYQITGQHRSGPASTMQPWQPSACRISGQTIRYEDGGRDGTDRRYNDAQVEIVGGQIEAIDPPCQAAPKLRIGEMHDFKKRAKPLMRGSASVETPTGAPPETSAAFRLPEFPFPPPDPSARLRIPNKTLTGKASAPTFALVAARMEAALGSNGYTELSYFAVPGGFALLTQIERINPDATAAVEQRWNVVVAPVSLRSFTLEAYLRALLQKDSGFFRVIVFIFSSEPFSSSGKKVPVKEAMKWIDQGSNTLPRDVASRPYGEDMVCTALVYEFEIPTHGADALLRKPSSHDGAAHLRASGILRALGE